jgi:hypothetical protein
MSNDLLDLTSVRGMDSNSLLRLYDQAKEVVAKAQMQQDRLRAEKAIQRIAKELGKRRVAF